MTPHLHVWTGLSRMGCVVLGISRCQVCNKKADAEDRRIQWEQVKVPAPLRMHAQ